MITGLPRGGAGSSAAKRTRLVDPAEDAAGRSGPVDAAAADPAAVDIVRRRGRIVRHMAAAVVGALLLVTTLFGQDADFPFAPFRMYATRDDPNGVVRILAVEAVLADGTTTDVTEAEGAPRRAELEGRIGELRDDPKLLASLAEPYVQAEPSAVSLRVVWREYQLIDGRSQPPRDRVLAAVDVGGDR
jgi:hypothetical protein